MMTLCEMEHAARDIRHAFYQMRRSLAGISILLIFAIFVAFFVASKVWWLWIPFCVILSITYMLFVHDCAAYLVRKRQIEEPWIVALFFCVTVVLVMAFGFCWLVSGSVINHPKLTGESSVYFSTVVLTTLGFGDIVPKSGSSTYLLMFQAIFGVTHMVAFFTIIMSRMSQQPTKQVT